jgi:hypothetical protein
MPVLKLTEKVTRVDIERTEYGLIAKIFERGWQVGYDWTDWMQPLDGCTIESMLRECELAGFTVEMCDNDHGRALRGEITRIDVLRTEKGWDIKKYPYGWSAKTRAITTRTVDEAEADKAVLWLREHGWSVRDFPGGHRAWKGEVLPVRGASEIRYLRNRITQTRATGHADERVHFDLSVDC